MQFINCFLLFVIKLLATTKSLPVAEQCGTLNESLIYNQTHMTTFEEYPWTALLGYRDRYNPEILLSLCQGVLISQRLVITAHRCITPGNGPELVSVVLGDWNPLTKPDCYENGECAELPEVYQIEEIILNRNYNAQTLTDDVGMLRLDRDVIFTKYIQPICLPPAHLTKNDFITKQLYLTGFPSPINSNQSKMELHKKKTFAQIISTKWCGNLLKTMKFPLASEHICGLIEDRINFKTGAPLMDVSVENNEPQKFYLIGILSNAHQLATEVYPDIFENIIPQLDWIQTNR